MTSGQRTPGAVSDQIAKAAAAKDADGEYLMDVTQIAKRYDVSINTVTRIIRDGNASWVNHLRWKDDILNRP